MDAPPRQVGDDDTSGCRRNADVIALTITDFTMFPARPDVVSKFKLRAEDGHLYSDDLELVFYSDDLELVFVELPKFAKTETELVDIQDKWFYFLKHAKDLTIVPRTLQDEPPLQHAFAIANRAALTPEELEAQKRREMFIQDQRGAVEKALTEGRNRGRAKGRAEGEREAARRIARSLLPVLADDAG